ncbi:MAG: PA0069 family radical SAM protein [Cyclobacteriaceae bacterium]|nr:PA0069 family radical SAM protein [Cyclobacteriaceae bacterium]
MIYKGRGAQRYLSNRFEKNFNTAEEAQQDPAEDNAPLTRTYVENPREILSRNDSPDIPFTYSINPYQGCEHGCIYCYARNSHEYWGFDAGLDFETKIIVKSEAPELLKQKFQSRSWKPEMIVLSGNTDCYQPVEKKLKITRKLLMVFRNFGNPVGIITKNVLILRDLDILKDLAMENLVKVIFSITTLDEDLRLKMEPRTATAQKKLMAIKKLTTSGIPVSVLMGPVIPGLNTGEIPAIIRSCREAGAYDVNMVMIRLNGKSGMLFMDWLQKNYPDREKKVWNQISSLHQGKVNDARWGLRMRGDGKLAESIHQLFRTVKSKYYGEKESHELSLTRFRRHGTGWLF